MFLISESLYLLETAIGFRSPPSKGRTSPLDVRVSPQKNARNSQKVEISSISICSYG